MVCDYGHTTTGGWHGALVGWRVSGGQVSHGGRCSLFVQALFVVCRLRHVLGSLLDGIGYRHFVTGLTGLTGCVLLMTYGRVTGGGCRVAVVTCRGCRACIYRK